MCSASPAKQEQCKTRTKAEKRLLKHAALEMPLVTGHAGQPGKQAGFLPVTVCVKYGVDIRRVLMTSHASLNGHTEVPRLPPDHDVARSESPACPVVVSIEGKEVGLPNPPFYDQDWAGEGSHKDWNNKLSKHVDGLPTIFFVSAVR